MRNTSRQQLEGKVISNKMQKTVVVEIETINMHPRYKKIVRFRKRYKAHDEKMECGLGDKVVLCETRPLSKDKTWRVVKILEKGSLPTGEIVEPEELFRNKKKKREEALAARAAAAKAAEEAATAKAAEEEAALKAAISEAAPVEQPSVEEAAVEAADADEESGDDDAADKKPE